MSQGELKRHTGLWKHLLNTAYCWFPSTYKCGTARKTASLASSWNVALGSKAANRGLNLLCFQQVLSDLTFAKAPCKTVALRYQDGKQNKYRYKPKFPFRSKVKKKKNTLEILEIKKRKHFILEMPSQQPPKSQQDPNSCTKWKDMTPPTSRYLHPQCACACLCARVSQACAYISL